MLVPSSLSHPFPVTAVLGCFKVLERHLAVLLRIIIMYPTPFGFLALLAVFAGSTLEAVPALELP